MGVHRPRLARRALVVALAAAALTAAQVPPTAQAAPGQLTLTYERISWDDSNNATIRRPGGVLTVTQGAVAADYVIPADAVLTIEIPQGTTTLTLTPAPQFTPSATTYVGDETQTITYDQDESVVLAAQVAALRLVTFAVQDPFTGTSATSGVAGATLELDAVPAWPSNASWTEVVDGGPNIAHPADVAAQAAASLTTDAAGKAYAYINGSAKYEYPRARASKTIDGVTWSGSSLPGWRTSAPRGPAYIALAPQGPPRGDDQPRVVAGTIGPMLGAPGDYTALVNGDAVTVDDRGWFRVTSPTSTVEVTMEDAYLAEQLPMPVSFTAGTDGDAFLDIAYPDSVARDFLPDSAGQPITGFTLDGGQQQCADLRVLGAADVSQGCATMSSRPQQDRPEVQRVRFMTNGNDTSNPELRFTATATGSDGTAPYPVSGVLPAGTATAGGIDLILLLGEASPQPPPYAAADSTDAATTVQWAPASSPVSPVTAYQVQADGTTTTVPATTFSLTIAAGSTVKVRSVNEYGPSAWKPAGTPDTTRPTASLAAVPAFTLAPSLRLTYSGGDSGSGVASYDLRLRRIDQAGRASAWTAPTGWTRRTARTATLALAPGSGYCVSARSRDRAGNVSAWTASRCTARAADDRRLAASAGWTRGSGTVHYLGTVTSSSRAGERLDRAGVRAGRVALVVTTCPTCGRVAVYLGGALLGRVSLRSTTTRNRVLLALPATTARTGTLSVRTLSPGGPVRVDGYALRVL